jgi:hypothetical protein
MRRLFWLGIGIGIGVVLVRRLSRAAEQLSPSGVASSIGAGMSELADGLREFAVDVRAAMSAREGDLRAAVGLDTGTPDPLG